jgi:hypothetical protein
MDLKKKYSIQDEDGVWVTFDDAKIKLLKPGSRLAEHAVNATIPLEHNTEGKTVDDLMRQTAKMVSALIVAWSGMTDDGEEVLYSKEVAEYYCYHFEDFRKFIEEEARKIKVEKAKDVKKHTAIKKK